MKFLDVTMLHTGKIHSRSMSRPKDFDRGTVSFFAALLEQQDSVHFEVQLQEPELHMMYHADAPSTASATLFDSDGVPLVTTFMWKGGGEVEDRAHMKELETFIRRLGGNPTEEWKFLTTRPMLVSVPIPPPRWDSGTGGAFAVHLMQAWLDLAKTSNGSTE